MPVMIWTPGVHCHLVLPPSATPITTSSPAFDEPLPPASEPPVATAAPASLFPTLLVERARFPLLWRIENIDCIRDWRETTVSNIGCARERARAQAHLRLRKRLPERRFATARIAEEMELDSSERARFREKRLHHVTDQWCFAVSRATKRGTGPLRTRRAPAAACTAALESSRGLQRLEAAVPASRA